MWENRSDVDLGPPLLQFPASALGFENSLLQRGRPRRFTAAFLFSRRNSRASLGMLSIFDRVEQTFTRQLSIHCLRPRVLNRDADSAGPVPQRHGGRNFVYVLTARATGARESFFKIDIANAKFRHSVLD